MYTIPFDIIIIIIAKMISNHVIEFVQEPLSKVFNLNVSVKGYSVLLVCMVVTQNLAFWDQISTKKFAP